MVSYRARRLGLHRVGSLGIRLPHGMTTIRPQDDNAVVPRSPSRSDVGRAWNDRAGLPGFLREIGGLSPVRRTGYWFTSSIKMSP